MTQTLKSLSFRLAQGAVARHMNLQLFAEGGQGAGTGQQGAAAQGAGAQSGQQQTGQQGGQQQAELPKTAEDLAKLIQSEADKRVSQALTTAQTKWQADLDAKVKEAATEATRLAGLNAADREKAQADKAAAELKQREAAIAQRELELKSVDLLAAKKLPLEFRPFVVAADETATALRVEQLSTLFAAQVQIAVDARLKQTGGTPNAPQTPNGQVNPWLKDSFNLTKQAQILRENPDLAKQLMAAAGR